MKIKIFLTTAFLLGFSAMLYAGTTADSLGVENQGGKKIILHKIDPKDNYYSLGRRYNVSPKAIIQYNNNVSLQIGHIVKVPTDRPFTDNLAAQKSVAAQSQNKPQAQQPVTKQAIDQKTAQDVANSNNSGITVQQYKVSQGETLYAIAKRFGTTVEDIITLNKLTSSIIPGQVLQVRTGVPAPAAVTHQADSIVAKRDSTAYAAADSLAERRGANRFGVYEKNEKGVATWIQDDSLDPNKKLILHRTAPIGTVMKITNPMTNRSTFAKVVGRFTDTQETKDVVIVMTKNVAESLGALDKRFHVNISYGAPNE